MVICLRHVDFITYLLLCIHLSYELEVLYMLFKTYFSFYQKNYICLCLHWIYTSYYTGTAHASLARTRCNGPVPSISVKSEVILCRADFQRPCLTSLKMQLKGWGNFRQCPAAWRLSAFFPGQSCSRCRGVEGQRLNPGSWGVHGGEVEVVTSSCQ